jgi:hypothetical protein
MFYGQTSNWLKIVESVTDNGRVSLPAVAAQYSDSLNAVRVHCGQEAQVQLHVQLFLTSQDDFERLDAFLAHFGLPRNGFTVVNTGLPYSYSASAAVTGVTGIVEQQAVLPAPGNHNNQRQP